MELHGFWQDRAVIRQGVPFQVIGYGEPNESVTVRLIRESDKQEVAVERGLVENGQFSITMPAQPGSFESYRLVCEGNLRKEFRDLLFGELWLASGQSNMEFAFRQCADREKMLCRVSPYIRYMNCCKPEDAIGATVSRPAHPVKQLLHTDWTAADTAEHTDDMSGVAFAMSAELLERCQVPIGVVCTASGGTSIEAWLPRDVVDGSAVLKEHLQKSGRYVAEDAINTFDGRNYTQMSGLYNERIAPLAGVPFSGLVWLQGESSAGSEEEAAYYTAALTALVTSWRERLRLPQMPCAVVHIAAENYQFEPFAVPHLNEGISRAVSQLENVWEEPVYDLPLTWRIENTVIGHPIHPSKKMGVGTRLAQIIHSAVYSGDKETLAPRAETVMYAGDAAVVRFSDVGKGLCCSGKSLRGFTVCGKNGVHVEADACITGSDTVTVRHPSVHTVCGVTYAYALYNQTANLYGIGGVPAVPFSYNTVPAVYTEPREWLFADQIQAFECCFEMALGGADYRNLWTAGTLSRFLTCSVTVADGVQFEYTTDWQNGCLCSVAPDLSFAGRYHGLELIDYLDVTVDNPDDRDKQFGGILIRTLQGRVYYLPVVTEEGRQLFVPLAAGERGRSYRVDLHSFYGCYLIPESKQPMDLSDMTAMEFVFKDECSMPGQVIIRRIGTGFWEE